MKLHIKLFLQMAIPFGVIIGVSNIFIGNSQGGIIQSITAGIFFGIIASLLTVFMHKRAVKKVSSNLSNESLDVCHSRTIETSMSYDKAFDVCLDIVVELSNFRVVKKDKSEGIIVSESGITKGSWGNTVQFEFLRISDEKTKILIFTRPKYKFSLVDYGENLRNIEKITETLGYYKVCHA